MIADPVKSRINGRRGARDEFKRNMERSECTEEGKADANEFLDF